MRWHCRAECSWLGLAASGWVVGFWVVGLAAWASGPPRAQQDGTYLVTGGSLYACGTSFSRPLCVLPFEKLMRTAAMRWIQNYQSCPDPSVEQKHIRPSAPSNSISRVCSRPAGTRIFKNRLFGGLRGRKGRETSRLAMFRGNKRSPVGRGVRIRV